MTNPNINNQPSEPANEAQLDGLLVQTQMAVTMGGAEGYFENENTEMTTMLPERQGSEALGLVPEAALRLGIKPHETIAIGTTMATPGQASALVEVANPEGEDYSHYTVEKKPDGHGGSRLTGTFYNTSMDTAGIRDKLELEDFEKFPIEGDFDPDLIKKGVYPLGYEEKSKEETETENAEDDPLNALGYGLNAGGERYFSVARGKELTSDQVRDLGEVIGALTRIPPTLPEA